MTFASTSVGLVIVTSPIVRLPKMQLNLIAMQLSYRLAVPNLMQEDCTSPVKISSYLSVKVFRLLQTLLQKFQQSVEYYFRFVLLESGCFRCEGAVGEPGNKEICFVESGRRFKRNTRCDGIFG